MKWFNWLTTAPKVIDDVFDKDNGLISQAGAWIGNQNLTAEEVMEANAKTVLLVQNHVEKTLDENTERSKARRRIAEKYVDFYLNWSSVGFASYFLVHEYSAWLLSALTGWAFGGAFSAVIIFHFGSYGLERHNKSKVKK